MDVTRTIRLDGGPMPVGMLEAMLRKEGMRTERAPDDRDIERRGID
jgi:hypothetical protein